jgi:hypothetical protein
MKSNKMTVTNLVKIVPQVSPLLLVMGYFASHNQIGRTRFWASTEHVVFVISQGMHHIGSLV